MRQFRFKWITVNTNLMVGPWLDHNLSNSPWICFGIHRLQLYIFLNFKKKGYPGDNHANAQ